MKLKIAAAMALLLTALSCSTNRPSTLTQDAVKPRETPVQVGETAPDFTLNDQQDRKITLSEARGQWPVILVFYRGNW